MAYQSDYLPDDDIDDILNPFESYNVFIQLYAKKYKINCDDFGNIIQLMLSCGVTDLKDIELALDIDYKKNQPLTNSELSTKNQLQTDEGYITLLKRNQHLKNYSIESIAKSIQICQREYIVAMPPKVKKPVSPRMD